MMVKYRGYFISGARDERTGVAAFFVWRQDAAEGEQTLVYEGLAEGRYATDEASNDAAYVAGRAYVDELSFEVMRAAPSRAT